MNLLPNKIPAFWLVGFYAVYNEILGWPRCDGKQCKASHHTRVTKMVQKKKQTEKWHSFTDGKQNTRFILFGRWLPVAPRTMCEKCFWQKFRLLVKTQIIMLWTLCHSFPNYFWTLWTLTLAKRHGRNTSLCHLMHFKAKAFCFCVRWSKPN